MQLMLKKTADSFLRIPKVRKSRRCRKRRIGIVLFIINSIKIIFKGVAFLRFLGFLRFLSLSFFRKGWRWLQAKN